MARTVELDPDEVPGWLAQLWPSNKMGSHVVAGVNDDDCAVLKWDSHYLVLTTDYLNSRPICRELGIGGWRAVGRVVFASNLSDLCGSGATPRAFLVAVTMPRGTTVGDFREIMYGIEDESRKYHVPVVGGDTKLGDCLAIAGVAIGDAKSHRHLFLKNRAEAGHLVWLSGPVGSCNAAVIGLSTGEFTDTWREWAAKRIGFPVVPLEKSEGAANLGLGGGGIDISDGFGEDLHRICDASDVGVVITAEDIPVEDQASEVARTRGVPPWALAFACGGDFQFALTASPRAERDLRNLGFHLVGEVTESRERQLRVAQGRTVPLPRIGHRDVRNKTFLEEIEEAVAEAASVQ